MKNYSKIFLILSIMILNNLIDAKKSADTEFVIHSCDKLGLEKVIKSAHEKVPLEPFSEESGSESEIDPSSSGNVTIDPNEGAEEGSPFMIKGLSDSAYTNRKEFLKEVILGAMKLKNKITETVNKIDTSLEEPNKPEDLDLEKIKGQTEEEETAKKNKAIAEHKVKTDAYQIKLAKYQEAKKHDETKSIRKKACGLKEKEIDIFIARLKLVAVLDLARYLLGKIYNGSKSTFNISEGSEENGWIPDFTETSSTE